MADRLGRNPHDAEAILRFRGDPEVMRFSIDGRESLAEVRMKYLPSCLTRYSRDGLGQWAVVRRTDNTMIGECGICVQALDGIREYEISYRLRRDCWGQGLATEAARACREYGFEEAGLDRLVSIIEPENAASIRVAEKVGMALEKEVSFHGLVALIYSAGRRASSSPRC